MEVFWWEDPVFDSHVEVLPDGKRLRGDDWRRLQFCRERAASEGWEGQFMSVAGTTQCRDAIQGLGTRPRDEVHLVPEPTNEEHEHALRVEVGDAFVGYIPRAKRDQVSPDSRVHVVKCGMQKEPHVWVWIERA